MKVVSPIGLACCGVTIAVPLHFWVARESLDQIPRFFQDGWLLASLLFSGGFSTGLAYAMWNYGVKTLGTSHAAIYQNLVPVFALLEPGCCWVKFLEQFNCWVESSFWPAFTG